MFNYQTKNIETNWRLYPLSFILVYVWISFVTTSHYSGSKFSHFLKNLTICYNNTNDQCSLKNQYVLFCCLWCRPFNEKRNTWEVVSQKASHETSYHSSLSYIISMNRYTRNSRTFIFHKFYAYFHWCCYSLDETIPTTKHTKGQYTEGAPKRSTPKANTIKNFFDYYILPAKCIIYVLVLGKFR